MLTLLLMRHAKSDWDHPDLDDHNRPLNPRGLRNAPLMGALIKDRGLMPQLCLSSTAVRARQTARLAISAIDEDVELLEVRELYDFGTGQAIAQAIASHGHSASPLLVIAHNPASQGFALETCGSGDQTALAQLENKYPTCALCQIEYNMTSWADISQTKGTLKAFTTPRMLG